MTKLVTFDCDGVLLDWVSGFRAFLKEIDGIETDPAGPCEYNMMAWIGVDDKAFVIDRVNRFNGGEGGYFENLSPVAGAVDAVEALRSAGYKGRVLTACNTDPGTVRARRANLERVFGGVSDITCIGLMESKRPYLEGCEKSWFIEDSLHNARLGAETGHHALLLEYPHNSIAGPDEPFLRVRDWDHVREVIHGPAPDLAAGY